MLKVVLIIIFPLTSVAAVEYSRIAEGVPEGMIPDCPGSTKPARIKPESLKKLIISVVGKHGNLTGSYDYYNMDNLAKNPDVDFRNKTVLYVGGYLDTTSWNTGRFLGQVYRKYGYNALILETLDFTATYYPHAVRYMRRIGKHVAEMLLHLRPHGLEPENIELVGISLGGHTMGFIAKNYRKMTGQNISSITAMDPAGPCFRTVGPDQRLDTSDADFVLSIITNMDGSGIDVLIGHVTFYVNGGEFQNGHFPLLPCDVSCSHTRAFFLWWSALIYPGAFIGVRCETIQQAKDGECYDRKPILTNTMDLYTDRSKTGIYYLRTSNRWPYALGKRGLRKPKMDMFISSRSSKTMERDVLKYIYAYLNLGTISISNL